MSQMPTSEPILARLSLYTPGPQLVRRNGDVICITVHSSYDYLIQLRQISTAPLALGWILHLSSKTWFDRQRLQQLISVLKGAGVEVAL